MTTFPVFRTQKASPDAVHPCPPTPLPLSEGICPLFFHWFDPSRHGSNALEYVGQALRELTADVASDKPEAYQADRKEHDRHGLRREVR